MVLEHAAFIMLDQAAFMLIDYHRTIGVVDNHGAIGVVDNQGAIGVVGYEGAIGVVGDRAMQAFLLVLSTPQCHVDDGSGLVGNGAVQQLHEVAFALIIALLALAELFDIGKGALDYLCDQILALGMVGNERMAE